MANYLAHKLKRIPIVYDSHEYYTGTPELVSRPRVQGVWKRIEKFIFPKLTDVFTVNDSIAELYRNEYGKDIRVIRNVPRRQQNVSKSSSQLLELETNKRIIILQGAGINIQRGAEEAVLSMQYLDDVLLLIIGAGDVLETLKMLVQEKGLSDRVRFLPKMPYRELMQYTSVAEIGLTLDKDTNINYRFSLPNKLFDYIHAGTPVLASPLPEIKKIVERYNIGLLVNNHEPEHIADQIKQMLNQDLKMKLKENLEHAASELNWENEEKSLKEVYSKYA
jgi:glycosyltransferase involved in cell wall biosynthesis